MAVSFEQALSANAPVTEEFLVKEWGGTVVLRGLSKLEVNEIRTLHLEGSDLDVNSYEKDVTIAGLVDPKITSDQYDLLAEGSAGTLEKIFAKIVEISKMGKGDLKQVQKTFRNPS